MSRHAVRRSLLLAPLSQHKGRFALSVLAIALGVALGYAVQLINHAAISEFAAAVQTLSGEADLAVRGPRAGFDEIGDRKSTRLNSSHTVTSYAGFCLK